ncbi:hypothetical protein PABG_07748 [Paracoccidioides brasiliensis Pb03]|nr:hypothetical protein PABG_07748 [Paracoccidioides brasiliensis Pb03]
MEYCDSKSFCQRLLKKDSETSSSGLVTIYGHYPLIDGDKTTYHRHPIHEFSFAALDGKEKWTSYKFGMSVYGDWATSHFKKLCSAVDELPFNANIKTKIWIMDFS